MLALIYSPALPGIAFWAVSILMGINAGLGIYVGYLALQNWSAKR